MESRVIVEMESDEVTGFHEKFHRHTLVDEAGHGVGVMGRADDGADPVRCQSLDGLGDRSSLADDDAAGLHLDGAELGLVTVSEDDQIVLLDVVFHQIGVGGRNDNFSFDKIGVLISHHHRAVQSFQNVLVLGPGCGKDGVVVDIHVGLGNIADRDQTFQGIALLDDGQGVHVLGTHEIPGLFQGNVVADAWNPADLHIFHPGSHIGHIARRIHLEAVQYILGFLADLSGPLGLKNSLLGPPLDIRIGDGRADGIRVRVLMADNVDLARCRSRNAGRCYFLLYGFIHR